MYSVTTMVVCVARNNDRVNENVDNQPIVEKKINALMVICNQVSVITLQIATIH